MSRPHESAGAASAPRDPGATARKSGPIVLIGLMGAGKSAVAAILSQRLKLPLADLDAMIEARAGCPVAEIFGREGEAAFRRREHEALVEALAKPGATGVLASGGGVVLLPENRALLRERCQVVWLEVSPRESARRVGGGAASRPMLGAGPIEGRLEALLRERAPLYETMADLRIPTEGRMPAEVAEAIVTAIAGGALPR
jgi:shikimate kinase